MLSIETGTDSDLRNLKSVAREIETPFNQLEDLTIKIKKPNLQGNILQADGATIVWTCFTGLIDLGTGGITGVLGAARPVPSSIKQPEALAASLAESYAFIFRAS